jgi:hypothetical protein
MHSVILDRSSGSRRIRGAVPVCLAATILIAKAEPLDAWPQSTPDPVGLEVPASELHGEQELDRYRISIVTFDASPPVLSRFGHSAVWVEDLEEGTSLAYNYGLSNTGAPGFLRQLARGEVLSRPSRGDAEALMERYATGDRTIWVQELNLTPQQSSALRGLLERDIGPTGSAAPQDFYTANCTTGIRDVLDEALGGQLRALTEGIPAEGTYRSHSLRYASADPLLYVGLVLGMGRWVDRPIDAWEKMFLPSTLREQLREVWVVDEAGEAVPLVAVETTWYRAGEVSGRMAPGWHWPLGAGGGLGMAALLLAVGWRAPGNRWRGVVFSGIAGLWLILVGTVGTALAGLWAFTGQYLAYANENLLVVHPLSVIAGWLLITGALGSETERRALRWTLALMAALGLVGVLMKLVSGGTQANGLVLLLTVPPYGALAWTLWRWEHEPVWFEAGQEARQADRAASLDADRVAHA